MDNRAIQIGLTGKAVQHFIQAWIVNITNITQEVQHVHQFVVDGKLNEAMALLAKETVYILKICKKFDEH